ncbi:hypothetical protein PND81_13340 [Flavonifractor plautii]|jgi:hypothetical protein|nr:hypothetical protein HMPREF0239_03700 [Clostridium sp. ATCC BAA-442]MDB7902305.1 hypothetical protein [Flavonifractor plautii]
MEQKGTGGIPWDYMGYRLFLLIIVSYLMFYPLVLSRTSIFIE